ncbi:MAG: hypothetical protein ACREOO_03110 [bacterium]
MKPIKLTMKCPPCEVLECFIGEYRLPISHHDLSGVTQTIHHCSSFRDADWIVYRCTACAYELRENWRTGELQVKNPAPAIRHFGGYFPQEYKEALENLN